MKRRCAAAVVGELLAKLDELGIADNPVVVFASDNGAEAFTWPDGGTSPFRGEKGLGWEGGFRSPLAIRWPGKIPAGQVLNGIMSLEDIVPTIMAAVGIPDILRNNSWRGTRGSTSTSACTSTATTNCPISPAR